MQLTTQTRSQRVANLLSQPLPLCTSIQYKHEYYKILWMLRELLDCHPKAVRELWMMNLLEEALLELHELDDPTSTPTNSRRDDNRRWTDVSVRRVIAETMWEEGTTVSFYDCYDILREGRSKAAQARLCEQVRIAWERVTGTDLGTEFSLTP